MINKILGRVSAVRSFVLAIASLATMAVQAVSTSYINSSGQSDTADCTEITSSSTTLNTGWYVVNGNVSIGSTVTVSGDANLILANGAKLTVTGSSGCAGICVVDDGETVNSLTIYCQDAGTGELSATGSTGGAGIGGNDKTGSTGLGDCGAVTIYGGVINATGGSYGAGIGGGDNYGNGGTVAIYGGTVTAKAVSSSTAGIGNGWASSNRGTLVVGAGRSVMAGESEATATVLTPDSSGAVTLSGQKWFSVTAPFIKQQTSELFEGYHSGVSINVSLADTIVGGSGTYTFTEKSDLPSWLSISGMSLVGTPPNTGTWIFTLTATDASDSSLTIDAEYTLYVQVTGDVSVTFVGANGASRTETCTVVEKSMTTLSDTGSSGGWYVVYNDVEFTSSVTVSGDVKLVLRDGKTMTVATDSGAAVNVIGDNVFTVYGQSGNTGRLAATTSTGIAAAIGGASSKAGGTVTINGGTVVATGGVGIGGAYNSDGGMVTINGGVVTATASSGAGIGGGAGTPPGAGGTVIINGGTVTANGGYSGAGIGGGSKDTSVVSQGTLTVGANVVVKAGSSSYLTDSDILPHGDGGAITLSGLCYFKIETVGPVPLAQTTSVLAAYVGEAFSQALSATVSGGTSSYSFEKTSGTLPDGLEFNVGVISGTPTAVGTANVVITVTDSGEPAQITNFTYTINVTQPPKSITYKDGNDTIYGLSPTQYTPGTATALAETASKPGYSFIGWYDDEFAGNIVTEVPASATDDLTFWGRWNLLNYTITYHNVTGELTPTNYTVLTPTVALPTPEVGENETFVGWYTTSTFTAGSLVTQIVQGSTGDKDFYAKITSNTPDPDPDPSGDGFIADDPEESKWSWAETVECQTASGVYQRKCEPLDQYSSTLNNSWYYVGEDLTLESLTIVGKVSLILGDGATLTVGSLYSPGIQLTQGNTLTIYGQSGGTGALVATGGDNCAGIGGKSDYMEPQLQTCGKLNVYGGNITATGGGDWAPGIGSTSMDYDSTGQIFVYGGTVTATGSDYYAGIGGYQWNGQGSLTVGDNMTVKAGADADSAVELTPGAGGAVTLSAQKYFLIESTGSVPLAQKAGTSSYTVYTDETFLLTLADTIKGGEKPYSFALKSGALPAGLAFDASYTTISGTPTTDDLEEQTIEMTVTDDEDTSITATYTIKATTRTKTITYIDGTDGITLITGLSPATYTPGGSSTVYLPYSATKEGYLFGGWFRTPDFSDTRVLTVSSSDRTNLIFYAKFIKDTPSYSLYYNDYEEATGWYDLGLSPSSYTSEDLPLDLPSPAPKAGFSFVGWCTTYDLSDEPITTLPMDTTGYKNLYAKWTENEPEEPEEPEPGETETGDVNYIDANGAPQTAYCTAVTADTTTLTNGGWYAVNANVARSGSIAVEGSAFLVLVDGKTLTVSEVADFTAGINVSEGCSLTIYGQSGGTGTLCVTGGLGGAGIGSGYQYNCGTVTINGGRVEATGGNSSSGIGGGAMGSGGDVTINGGYVVASSPTINVPGIGKGSGSGVNGTLTVSTKMVVKAGLISIHDDDDIREADPVTHQIAIQSSWTNFLIEEEVVPVGTFSTIYYHDGSSVIDQLEPSQYEEGVGVSLTTAVPVKDGYTFGGWYATYACDGDEVTAISVDATGEQHLWAKWTPIVYSITYYLKGVPVELEPSTYTATNALTMLPEYPNGYYVSWYTNDQFTGEKQLAISYGSYGNKEFWAKISSAIGYKAEFYDGETLLTKPSSIFFDVESDTIVLPRTAYKDGYRFIGWYDNVGLDGDPVTTIPAGSISNKQFYAKWEATTDPVFTVDSEGNLIHFALNSATEITIPNNVYNIDSLLCYGGDYSAMTSLVIPGTVTNIGDSAFSSCTGLTNLTIEAGVKTIGDSAFFGCTALTCGEDGLYIPDSVTSIGNNAFVSTGLAKVSLPGAMYSVENDIHRGFGTDIVSGVIYRTNDTVFYISDGLLWAVDPKANTDITIPARVDRIGPGALHEITTVQSVQLHSGITNIAVAAFSGCTGLQSIDIPGSVECIGNGSFYGCSGLTNLTIEAGVKLIDSGAFNGCSALTSVVIPGSVERVADMAFWDCVALSSLTIEYGVKTIEEFAFCGCSSLVNITLPKGLEIERFAFVDCTSLKSVNISGNVVAPKKKLMAASARRMLLAAESAPDPDATSVGDYAFIGCRALESARIGSKVNEIGGGAFAGCAKLASITVEEGNDNFKAEDGMLFSKDCTTLISAFGEETSLVVSNSVVTIADGAFAGYETLQSVVLPSGVTTIGEAAFSNATVFASITIPASVTTIGANAFCDTALATVYVSKGDTARVKTLVEGTGYAGAVAYVESGDEPTEWPEDTSTIASQTAAEAFGITEGPLTNVNAKVLADWAKDSAKGNVSYAEIGSIIPDAFLLNCANNAAAVEAAEAVAEEAIKITAITFDSEGNPVLTCPEAYGNGQVVIKGSVEIGASASWHDKTDGDRFFKTVLELK